MKSILKTKIWLYVVIKSRTRLSVNLQSKVVWLSRDWWKQVQSLSDCNGTQNFAKWLSVNLRATSLRVRILLLSHIKFEKIFRSMTGIIIWSIQHYFFSILSKNMALLLWTEKNDTLEAFTGISFFHVYEILLCKFYFKNMKSIEI